MSRTWVNGSPPFLNAANLNAMEADIAAALAVPDTALATAVQTGATAAQLNATYAPASVSTSKADKTTTVSAGTGLTGGGDLSADRTLAVAYGTAAGTAAQGNDSRITGAAQAANNLSDLASAPTARTNLGLGDSATHAASDFAQTVSSTGGVKVTGDQGLSNYQFRGSNSVAGAPTTGTYAFNDVVRDVNGQTWVCITGGSPGVWNPANPGFIAQLPQAFNKTAFTKMNAGSSVTFSATPFTLTVVSTTGFPSTGKLMVGTGVPGGTVPVHLAVSYTGTTGTTFTGCTIVGADVVVPDGQDVFYGKSDLRGGTLTVANQIIANSAIDGRPHDLVLLAAFDPSVGHTYGDYDVIISREAGSFGVLQVDIPMRATQDISFGDSLNNRLMTIAGGNGRTADQGATVIPAQSIVFAGTVLGDQGSTKSFVYKNRQTDSQFIFQKSDGTKLFYFQDAGPTLANTSLLLFTSSNGSGSAYFTMTSGNNFSCTVGAGGARWMNNAFTTQILTLTNTGSLVLGPTLALSAVDGFPYMPSGAGAPTGTPTAQSGHSPFFYDTTNHKLWVYDGGWKGTVLS